MTRKITSTFILIAIFSLFAFNIDAQAKKKVYQGYIVTIEDDTLYGKIQMLNPALNEVKVKFIHKDGTKKLYRAKELTAYAFKVPGFKGKKYQTADEWIYYTKKTMLDNKL